MVNKKNPKLKIKKDFLQIAKNIYYKKKQNKGKWIIIIVYSITIADTLLTKKRIKKKITITRGSQHIHLLNIFLTLYSRKHSTIIHLLTQKFSSLLSGEDLQLHYTNSAKNGNLYTIAQKYFNCFPLQMLMPNVAKFCIKYNKSFNMTKRYQPCLNNIEYWH